eukprot:328618-Pyramimonas_sp.AAC.1
MVIERGCPGKSPRCSALLKGRNYVTSPLLSTLPSAATPPDIYSGLSRSSRANGARQPQLRG